MVILIRVPQQFANRLRIAGAVATGSAMVAVLAGCSSGDLPAQTHSPGEAVSSDLPVPELIDDPEEAAIAAYERYWRTVAEATTVPDPQYGPLNTVAAGEALEWARTLVQTGVDEDHRGTGYPSHDVEVTETYPETEPTRVAVSDCMDSTDWLVLDADSGEPVADEEYGTSKVSALVEFVDDSWLVTELLKQGIG